MAKPKLRICFHACEKVVFDAKNARLIPPLPKPAGCPELTDADQAAIKRDIEADFKGEIETVECTDKDCRCEYGQQPPWPNVYDTIELEWTVERKKGKKKCTYVLNATVDTASVTVPGKCKRKPGAKKIKGKSDLPPIPAD